MRLRACILAIAVVTPLRAFAQTPAPPAEAAPPPAAPPPAAVPAPPPAPPPAAPAAAPAPAPAPAAPAGPAPKFTFGGLADTYWMYYFNPATGSNSTAGPSARAFDTNGNSITLALAKVSMNAALDPVTLQVDVGYGTVASIINSNNGGPAAAAGAPWPGSFMIEQAYGNVALPGNFSLDFGKFVTTAGAEVIEANKNWLYSRSILFNVIPLVHTGARANLKVNDNLTLQASLVNGWNNDPDLNAWKTIGLNASITVNPMVSIIPTVYVGKETAQPAGVSTPGDTRFLVDLVVPITVNDKVGLNLNVDFIDAPNFFPFGVNSPTPDNSSNYIFGVAAMGRFVLAPQAYLAVRGEFVRTHIGEGGASVNNNMGEGTVMLGVPLGKNFELRPELRGDFSGDAIFAGGGAAGKKNQFTGTLAALTFF
ncbi:MAG TPA: outer membrane beta-barrel protein [Polyangia bacterium]|nr:outer membrane beta-barrel protein [Polyangia bacterium]